METAARARLLAAAPVSTLVGARVYWEDRPQGSTLPDVTLSIVSDARPQHLKGFQKLIATDVQIDVRATSYGAKRTLREAVKAALVTEHTGDGIIFNRASDVRHRPLNERTETQFIHRDVIEMVLWWQTEE